MSTSCPEFMPFSKEYSPLHNGAIAFGYVLTCVGVAVLTRAILPFLRVILHVKPDVVKKSTRRIMPSMACNIVDTVCYCLFPLRSGSLSSSSSNSSFDFEDLIFPVQAHRLIQDFAKLTSTQLKTKDACTHLILHGPDRAGKILLAQRLASVVGIEFAYISGRDIITTGEESVSQMQTLFAWARASPTLLLFDEAESFLAPIKSSSLMNDMGIENNSLGVFLYNISKKKLRKDNIIVLSVDRLEALDRDVLDQISKHILVPLPDSKTRERLLRRFWTELVESNSFSAKSLMGQVTKGQPQNEVSIEDAFIAGIHLEQIVAATRGFSGDDIRDLIFSLQDINASSVAGGQVNFAEAWRLIEEKVSQHRNSQEAIGEHTISYLDGDLDLVDVELV